MKRTHSEGPRRYRRLAALESTGARERWLVEDEETGEECVLVRHLEIGPDHPAADEYKSWLRRLMQSADQCPAIHPVLDGGVDPEIGAWMVHPRPGETLADRLDAGSIDGRAARRLLLDISRALDAFHTATSGCVHGAVTPGAVIVSGGGYRLSEFVAPGTTPPQSAEVSRCAAPEAETGDIDVRSDLYALGHTVMIAVGDVGASQRPPDGPDNFETSVAWRAWHLSPSPAGRLSNLVSGEAAASIDTLTSRMTAKAPDQRPATAAAVLDELGVRSTSAHRAKAKRRRLAAVTTALAMTCIAAVSLLVMMAGSSGPRMTIRLAGDTPLVTDRSVATVRGVVAGHNGRTELHLAHAGAAELLTLDENGAFEAAIDLPKIGRTTVDFVATVDNSVVARAQLPIERRRPNRITLKFVGPAEAAGASVEIRRRSGRRMPINTTLDGSGRAEVEVGPGSFDIRIVHAFYADCEFDLTTGSERRQTFNLPLVSIRHEIAFHIDPPSADVQIVGETFRAQTTRVYPDENGLVRTPLVEGEYVVHATAPGYTTVRQRLTVSGPRDQPVVIRLSPAPTDAPPDAPRATSVELVARMSITELADFVRGRVPASVMVTPEPAIDRIRLSGVVIDAEELAAMHDRLQLVGDRATSEVVVDVTGVQRRLAAAVSEQFAFPVDVVKASDNLRQSAGGDERSWRLRLRARREIAESERAALRELGEAYAIYPRKVEVTVLEAFHAETAESATSAAVEVQARALARLLDLEGVRVEIRDEGIAVIGDVFDWDELAAIESAVARHSTPVSVEVRVDPHRVAALVEQNLRRRFRHEVDARAISYDGRLRLVIKTSAHFAEARLMERRARRWVRRDDTVVLINEQ